MYDRLFASLMFFTRLPWGRIKQVNSECFKHVVDFWPITGWITGGTMALVFWICASHLPIYVAAILAVSARILLTGALHEDGWADFCDAFGSRNSRERTLAIMKDSHIGTYGVLGLVLHTASLVALLCALPLMHTPILILIADIYAKVNASWLVCQLPYARSEQEAKARVVYTKPRGKQLFCHAVRCIFALLPILVWCGHEHIPLPMWALLAPPLVEWWMVRLMRHRIGGYTGDCCGATFLLCELVFYITYSYCIH